MASKYFTPALRHQDSTELFRVLGFYDYVFLYIEKLANTEVFSTFPFSSPSGIEPLRIESIDWWAVFDHGNRPFQYPPQFEAVASKLWEVLVPFPLWKLFPDRQTVKIYPEKTGADFYDFYCAVDRLEGRLKSYELCLLVFQRGEASFPILLHYVRGKLVRVGTRSSLVGLGASLIEAGKRVENISHILGTRSLFLHIEISSFRSQTGNPADALANALNLASKVLETFTIPSQGETPSSEDIRL